jgi:FkbM family methyltransferase
MMAVFLNHLKEKGFLNNLPITVGIVGSRKINPEDKYGDQGWQIFGPNLTIYGFDADPDACEAANLELAQNPDVNWVEKHIPLGLGKSIGEQTLYVTHAPMCSSLYLPNETFLSRFAGLQELAGLDFSLEIETTTLDQFCKTENITEIDFLQIDVQGADLDVLQGAVNLLSRSVLGIQIEVEFSPLYTKQPLFRDIDHYLDKFGFSLFDLMVTRLTRTKSPICSQTRAGQILWGDAIYLRDLIDDAYESDFKTPKRMLKLACLADVLQFPDFTLEILEHLTLNYGKDPHFNFTQVILESLTQFPELKDRGIENLPIFKSLEKFF